MKKYQCQSQNSAFYPTSPRSLASTSSASINSNLQYFAEKIPFDQAKSVKSPFSSRQNILQSNYFHKSKQTSFNQPISFNRQSPPRLRNKSGSREKACVNDVTPSLSQTFSSAFKKKDSQESLNHTSDGFYGNSQRIDQRGRVSTSRSPKKIHLPLKQNDESGRYKIKLNNFCEDSSSQRITYSQAYSSQVYSNSSTSRNFFNSDCLSPRRQSKEVSSLVQQIKAQKQLIQEYKRQLREAKSQQINKQGYFHYKDNLERSDLKNKQYQKESQGIINERKSEYKNQLRQIKNDYQRLRQNTTRERFQYEKTIDSLSQQANILRQEIQNLKCEQQRSHQHLRSNSNTQTKYEQKIKTLSNQKIELRSQLSKLQQQNSMVMAKDKDNSLSQKYVLLQQAYKNLKKQNEKLQDLHSQLLQKSFRFNHSGQNNNEKQKIIKHELQQLQNNYSQLKQSYDRKKNQLETLYQSNRKVIADSKAKENTRLEERQRFLQQIKQMKEQLLAKDSYIQVYTTQIQSLRNIIKLLEQNVAQKSLLIKYQTPQHSHEKHQLSKIQDKFKSYSTSKYIVQPSFKTLCNIFGVAEGPNCSQRLLQQGKRLKQHLAAITSQLKYLQQVREEENRQFKLIICENQKLKLLNQQLNKNVMVLTANVSNQKLKLIQIKQGGLSASMTSFASDHFSTVKTLPLQEDEFEDVIEREAIFP